tara:strand:+ start:53 stop:799 length:747 start_codon:yes stop_codon:yes gene_type:complete
MEQQQQFPAEEVTLPSKGILYSPESPLKDGILEMKYMTAREEDILTNQNLIANGTVIDKLLQSLIISKIDYNELLIGDKDALMVAARVLGYGSDYSFTYRGKEITVDLSTLKDKPLSAEPIEEGKNEFEFTLPISKTKLTFKLLTHKDENEMKKELDGLRKIDKNSNKELSTRLKYIILSVDGDYEKATIRNFVDNRFLAKEAREFRKYVNKIQPSVDLSFEYEDNEGDTTKVDIPVGLDFFWPDATI